MKENTLKDTLDDVKGGVIVKVACMVRALGKCVLAMDLGRDRFQAELWHQAHSVKGYKHLTKAWLTVDDYAEDYPKLAAYMCGLWKDKWLDAFQSNPEEFPDLDKNFAVEPCEFFYPDFDDLQRVIYVQGRLEVWLSQFVADYKQAFGRMSMSRRRHFNVELIPVSHAGVYLVKVGNDVVVAIPWSSISDWETDDDFYRVVIGEVRAHDRMANVLAKIRNKLEPVGEDDYWSNHSS